MTLESEENRHETAQHEAIFPREFHIWDLPQNRIYARLDDEYRRAISTRLLQRFGSVALSELFDADPKTMRGWVIGNTGRMRKERTGYVRLDALLRLANMAEDGFSAEEIERHVVALKGYRCSLPASGVRLPFIEGSSMIRILMHFIGDGAAYPIVGSNKASSYTNKNASLRQGFISCLKDIFGDVSGCVSEKTFDENRAHVSVPKWIPYLFAHFYPDASFGQLKSKLPNVIFSLPRELRIEAIRTLADDDGSVQELCIRFVSGSPALLEDMRRLLLQLVREDAALSGSQKGALANSISPVRNQRNWYRLDLGSHALGWYSRTVGFSHPDKARELEFRIKAAELTKHSDALARDFLIFSDLLSRPMTAQEIAFANLIREEYVHESLGFHLAHGRVIRSGKSLRRKKAAAQWSLTQDGRNWFPILSLVNRNRSKDFMRNTLPKRDYMRYRWLRHDLSL